MASLSSKTEVVSRVLAFAVCLEVRVLVGFWWSDTEELQTYRNDKNGCWLQGVYQETWSSDEATMLSGLKCALPAKRSKIAMCAREQRSGTEATSEPAVAPSSRAVFWRQWRFQAVPIVGCKVPRNRDHCCWRVKEFPFCIRAVASRVIELFTKVQLGLRKIIYELIFIMKI